MDEPDGINDIIDAPPPMEIPLVIDPMADLTGGRADQAALRDIMVRRNKIEIAAGDSVTVLDERESDILKARRLSEEPKTLEELSAKFKISRERVRQIETKAFEKLQKSMINASKSKNLLTKD